MGVGAATAVGAVLFARLGAGPSFWGWCRGACAFGLSAAAGVASAVGVRLSAAVGVWGSFGYRVGVVSRAGAVVSVGFALLLNSGEWF